MRISTQFCYQGWGTRVNITRENSRHLARVQRRGEAEVNSRRIWNKLHYCIRNIFYFLVDTFTGIGNQELVGKVENFMFYIDSNVTGQITLRVVHWLQPASKHYLHFIGRGKRNNLIWPAPPPLPAPFSVTISARMIKMTTIMTFCPRQTLVQPPANWV